MDMQDFYLGTSPQLASYADKPGAYSLLIDSSKSHVKPGETVKLRIFISGYGIIRQPKLRVQPPSEAFVEKESTISFGLNKVPSGVMEWGTTTKELYADGVTISLVGGIIRKDALWDEASFIIDADNKYKTNIILTESSTKGKAPIELNIKTKNDVRPGDHVTVFTFVYFNGKNWVTQDSKYNFIVLSWYERNQLAIWVIGTIITLGVFMINFFADHPGLFLWCWAKH